jgi:hypothetical protein
MGTSQSAARATAVIARMKDEGIYVGLAFTHVAELIRHHDSQLARDRLVFLRSLPMIAWVRPYDRNWFPGAIPDVLCRELHAVVHGSAKDWRDIVTTVRDDLWETGTGADLFLENDRLWAAIRSEAQHQHEREKYIASIARTDPGQLTHLKLSELAKMTQRPALEQPAYMRRFVREMTEQLQLHGDLRLPSVAAATAFAGGTVKNCTEIRQMGGDPVYDVIKRAGIPLEFVNPNMTLAEIGELGVYVRQLKIVSDKLRPFVSVTIRDVPPRTLPTYAFERKIRSLQQKADRVSGSDLGDGQLASLLFYADAVEVDKRTLDIVSRIQRADSRFATLMGKCFRSSDYAQVPQRIQRVVA